MADILAISFLLSGFVAFVAISVWEYSKHGRFDGFSMPANVSFALVAALSVVALELVAFGIYKLVVYLRGP